MLALSTDSPASQGGAAAAAAASATTVSDDGIEDKYKKMTQREHIYKISDTYVGSAETVHEALCLLNGEGQFVFCDSVSYVPALYKIVDELLVNAWDQRIRLEMEQRRNPSAKFHAVQNLKISIGAPTESSDARTANQIVVYNDGEGIDIAMHPKHGIYTVELIFAHLLTSTNYTRAEQLTGGKNGFGAKLANVFSHRFEVVTVDAKRHLKYTQVYENNMQTIHPPVIKPCKGSPYTQITMVPDLERFGMTHWNAAMIQIVQKRAYDMAACMGVGTAVYFNDQRINCNGIEAYMGMFPTVAAHGVVHEIVNERWEIGASMSDDGFRQVSFVNGIATLKGGKHVDYIANALAKKMVELIQRKKKIVVKVSYVKENLILFVKALIANPSFDSQTKETLTTSVSKFGSRCDVPDRFIDRLAKMGMLDRVVELHQFKEESKQKKDCRKRQRLSGIPKLDDANLAGGARSAECTLILTEGDSAKAMAVAGLAVVGRDTYGVFPLRGKMLNTREKQMTAKGKDQIANNAEIIAMKKILGLETGKKYTTLDDLRYGHVMIMTDQDVDGSHIKALFMNWIATSWPELMDLGFITSMITPIIKVRKGTREKAFYSIGQYLDWKEAEPGARSWTVKYYKGLGTSTTAEAKEYFRKLHQVHYEKTDQSEETLDMAFARERADDRKAWMQTYDERNTLDATLKNVRYEKFINEELIHFAVYDLQRSIGHVMDGLKPSQRKILFGCFKRKLTKEIKVAQLAGYVSEHTGYHHGEQSLNMAIIGMAQQFIASNNINLLQPNGQFGTRLQGGKDAASPRYIFTLLSPLTTALFPQADMPLLEYLEDDGSTVEPKHYAPILPVALINGVVGVGMGYSTSVPMYNPLAICDAFLARLSGGPLADGAAHTAFPMLQPYYHGFTGTILQVAEKTFMTKGRYKITSFKTVEILELPVGTWTDDYKAFLETLLVDYQPPSTMSKRTTAAAAASKSGRAGVLRHYSSHSTESTVHFVLEFKPDALQHWIKECASTDPHMDYFEKALRLTSKISLSNMNLFNCNGVIQKYETPVAIMEEFYQPRLDMYAERKAYMLAQMMREIEVLRHKIRFIEQIIADEIVVHKRSKAELITVLEELQYPRLAHEANTGIGGGGSGDGVSYNYLLNMPIYSMTLDTVANLREMLCERQDKHDTLDGTTSEQLWHGELAHFREQYTTMLKKAAAEEKKSMRKSKVAAAGDGTTSTKAKKPAASKKKSATSTTKKAAATTVVTT